MTETAKIPDKIYFKIGEVSDMTGVKPHVLRYWESEFEIFRPAKTASNQRLYKQRDLDLIFEIKRLLYDERFTIAGAKKVSAKRPAAAAFEGRGPASSPGRRAPISNASAAPY
ncbi:MAG: MerR family transcriptional regulator [Deltaproteobacteria bacterium]|nr:MerR family transcriptional regulator [Deltaproteobacteria bacterium]